MRVIRRASGRLERRPLQGYTIDFREFDKMEFDGAACGPMWSSAPTDALFVMRREFGGPPASSREPLNLGLQVFALRRWLGSSFSHRATHPCGAPMRPVRHITKYVQEFDTRAGRVSGPYGRAVVVRGEAYFSQQFPRGRSPGFST